LEGESGRVFELPVDADGYFYAVMDRDCTTIDPRAEVGFRMDEVEKEVGLSADIKNAKAGAKNIVVL
jgi:hypothetical protein